MGSHIISAITSNCKIIGHFSIQIIIFQAQFSILSAFSIQTQRKVRISIAIRYIILELLHICIFNNHLNTRFIVFDTILVFNTRFIGFDTKLSF